LLTSTSSRPKAESAASIMAFTAAARETSVQTKRAVPPSRTIASTSRRPPSSLTSAATTLAPSRAKRAAIASPNPEAAPVTTAVLP